MKCYKDVMLKKMLEKKWRSVELSICIKWASRFARRISCNRLYSPCFLRRENIGRTHMLCSFFWRRRSAISKSNSNSSSLPELWSIVNNTCQLLWKVTAIDWYHADIVSRAIAAWRKATLVRASYKYIFHGNIAGAQECNNEDEEGRSNIETDREDQAAIP